MEANMLPGILKADSVALLSPDTADDGCDDDDDVMF